VLNTSPIGTDDNFFELGGDSILTLRLVSEAAAAGFQITPKQVFLHQTIAEIARVATVHSETSAATYVGSSPLLPIQRQFFATTWHNPHRFTQSLAFHVAGDMTAQMLEAAWRRVAQLHPAWSSRFTSTDGEVYQVFSETPDIPQLEIHRMHGSEAGSVQNCDVDRWIEQQQARLNIFDGPVVAADYYEFDRSAARLLIISAHHLVVDAVSWQTVVDQIQDACRQIRENQSPRLSPATTHIANWSAVLHRAASTHAVQRHRAKWLHWPASPMARDAATTAKNLVGSAQNIAFSLDPELTDRLLHRAVHRYRTRVDEFLLAAWCKSLADRYSNRQVRIDVELHGRDAWFAHDNLSETVGWFTAAVPVQINVPFGNEPHEIVPAVKDQLREFTRFGLAFGSLRWLTDDPELQREFPDGLGSQFSFNYLGRLERSDRGESVLKLATDRLETAMDPHDARWHLLDLIGLVRHKQLQLQLTFHPDIHAIDEVTALFQQFTETLVSYIASLAEPHLSSPTPSDFPYADVTARELASILARVRRQHSTGRSV
jgi:non-ribosomal peptide synthase protein (TIGR01720 family)